MMGAVWRVSERDFAKLKRELRDTGCVENLDAYGKCIIERLYTIDELKPEAPLAP
jgi:hypothetical protein